MGLGTKLRFGLVLAGGVVGSGLAKHLLTQSGLPTLGSVAWVFGYALTFLVLWYVWFRPIEFTGSAGG